jgi:DNA-binding response OmpR family regulator
MTLHAAHPSRPADAILLVEDDLSLQHCLNEFLRDHGYQTLLASTVQGARQLLKSHRPMLCILDLNLPDGSGLEILKEAARQAGCRAIVMTAFDLEHMRPDDIGQVLAGWLDKPVIPHELLQLVEVEMARLGPVINT